MYKVVMVLVFAVSFAFAPAAMVYAQYEDSEERQVSEMSSSLEKEIQTEDAAAKEDMGEMEASTLGNEAPMSPLDVETRTE